MVFAHGVGAQKKYKQISETQPGTLVSNSAKFGSSVSQSSTGTKIVAVGAPDENTYGCVYIYENDDYTTPTYKINPPAQGAVLSGNYQYPSDFGSVVYLSGDGQTLIVGDHKASMGPSTFITYSQCGVVYIYTRNVDATWSLSHTLYHATPHAGMGFGFDVATNNDGTRLLVGAPFYNSTGPSNSRIGGAFLYRKISGTWTYIDELKIDWGTSTYTKASNQLFGYSLDFGSNGTNILIGCPGYNNNTGAVFCFFYTTTNILKWKDILQYPNTVQGGQVAQVPTNGSFFGSRIRIVKNDGNYAIVSAVSNPTDSGGTNKYGQVYYYTRGTYSSTDVGTGSQNKYFYICQMTPTIAPSFGDYFGWHTSVTRGKFVLVSSTGRNNNTGAVYIFKSDTNIITGYGNVTQIKIIDGNTIGGQFGTSVVWVNYITRDAFVCGEPLDGKGKLHYYKFK